MDAEYLTPSLELVDTLQLTGGGGFGDHDIPPFGTSWGRPHPTLVAVARRLRDEPAVTPAQILAEAAVEYHAATLRSGGSRRMAMAIADLTVSGRSAWAKFRASPPLDAPVLEIATRLARSRGLAVDRLGGAVRGVLDRAYVIAWNLRGPLGFRKHSRAAQSWIASVSEVDPPHRPLNVPSAPFPQHDIDVVASGITVTTRVVIASSRLPDSENFDWSHLNLRTLPAERPMWIPPEDEVVIFIHGHSSRAEESMALGSAMQAEAVRRGRSLTVISFDLPSNGYSSMIDPDRVSPLDAVRFHLLGAAAPVDSTYPGLNFIENHIRGVVDALDRTLQIKRRIIGVIGGSLGGNMALRLGYRSDVVASWGANRVAWSPASAWGPSWAGATLNPFENRRHHYHDIAKHEGVRITRDRTREAEGPGSRDTYFHRVFEGAWPEPAQSGRWYRDGWCDKQATIDSAIRDRMEIYNELFRRFHWRIAHEQVVFSHFEPLTTDGRPRYESMRGRLMLAVGLEDNALVDKIYDNVIGHMAPGLVEARRMAGRAFGVANTGHSIQAERPNWWARTILDFLSEEMWALRASNGRFVTVAQSNPQRLVATSNMIGSWERLRVIKQTAGDVGFEIASDYNLSAENGGGGRVLPNRTSIRTWERFEVIELVGNEVAIRTPPSTGRTSQYWTLDGDTVRVTARDSRSDASVFYRVDLDGTPMLWRANGTRSLTASFGIGSGTAAVFRLVEMGRNEIGVRAPNGAFVSAANGGGAGLIAQMRTPGRWGVFTRESGANGVSVYRTDSGRYLVDRSGTLRADGTRAEATPLSFMPAEIAVVTAIDPGVLRPALGRPFPFPFSPIIRP